MGDGFALCPVRRKRCHRSLASAKKTIHELAGKGRVDTVRARMEAFFCPHCRWFHIGHSVMKTTQIYADSIRRAKCTGRNCYRPIWWAQIVETGKQMPFDREPVALEAQHTLFGDREIWTVDLEANHWATCVNAPEFKR